MEKKLSLVEGAPSYPRQLYREFICKKVVSIDPGQQSVWLSAHAQEMWLPRVFFSVPGRTGSNRTNRENDAKNIFWAICSKKGSCILEI